MPGNGYKSRLRVRVCAFIVRNDTLLLARLQSPVRPDPIWIPPGGEVKRGETLAGGVKREVYEETGLFIEPGRISLIHEFIEDPLHAVEFYFACRETGGKLQLGKDPERDPESQILLDMEFTPFAQLQDRQVYPEILKKHIHVLASASGEIMHSQTI